MAAEDSVRQIDHPRPEFGGHHTSIRHGSEGATQSFTQFSPLKASSGRLIEVVTDDVTGLVGIAAEAASGTTGADLDYIPLDGSVSFEFTLEDFANGDHELAITDLYRAFAIREAAAGGIFYLDENDTANAAFRVIELVDPIGTVQGRVRAVPLQSVTIYA